MPLRSRSDRSGDRAGRHRRASRNTMSLPTSTSPSTSGSSCRVSPGLAAAAGRSSSRKLSSCGDSGSSGSSGRGWAFGDCRIGAQGGQQALAVAERPAQSIEIDKIIPRRRFDHLAERFQIDRVSRGLGAGDVSPQRGNRPVVIREPQATQSAIAVRNDPRSRSRRQQLEGRGR